MNDTPVTLANTLTTLPVLATPTHNLPVAAEAPAATPAAPANAVDEAVAKRMAEIDIRDTGTIISFGSAAQAGLQEISRSMLGDVRNKDLGPAGEGLNSMVTVLRGFKVEDNDLSNKQGFIAKMMGKAAPIARFKAKFDKVQAQIDEIATNLERHQLTLLKDIQALDRLYAETLSFYDQLAIYIAAGEAKIAEIETVAIPEKQREMEAANESDQLIAASELRDLQSIRDDLERRVHDLKLTRQVTMQSLPSIRLVQENDKSLVAKITSTLKNTVPLWETQLAQAITIQRAANAARDVKAASDLTNELLTANASNLRQANTAIRTEMERGIFDVEAIRKANEELIGTIEDSLRIADEGKAKRAAAEQELIRMETDLRNTLVAAKAPARAAAN